MPLSTLPADQAAAIRHFAKRSGIDPRTLIIHAIRALALQIQQHGCVVLPLQFTAPSCAYCTHAAHEHPTNVKRGPW